MEDSDLNLVDYELVDKDNCSSKKIISQFSNKYIETYSRNICKPDIFCSPILIENSTSSKIASVFTDNSINVINKGSFEVNHAYKPHKQEITCVKFCPVSSELIYSSSLDGNVHLWDCRSGKIESTICANTEEVKPLTALDISPQGRLLCAGTELVDEDAFLLFWDLRSSKLLGGYWESHSDEITSVNFDPNHPKTMASAGTDGLLNVFDTSQSSEDDALIYCLNTNDTVKSFCWGSCDKKSNILAYTDVMSIQLWDIEESGPSINCSRENITKSLHRSVADECYAVPVNYSFPQNPLILAASGLEHLGTPCFRILRMNEKNGDLEPHARLIPSNEKRSSIVQNALFDLESERITTLTEDGLLCMWKLEDAKQERNKIKSSFTRKRKVKPY